MSLRPALSAAAVAILQGCASLFGEPDWRFGEPPPPLPVTAYGVEGEIRDFATLAPISNVEIVVTTGREGYAARSRSDAAGRFSIGFSALAKEYTPGDAFADVLLGTDSSNDLVGGIEIRVTSPGRFPVVVRYGLERIPKPLVLYMERFSGDEPIGRINPGSRLLGPRP